MTLLTCCSSLLCAAALAVAPAPAETPDILPAAKSGFMIEVKGDSGPTLLDIVNDYQRATSINLVISKDVLGLLAKSETGLRQSLVVPPERVHTLVETFLAQGGFCTTLLHASDPLLLGVKTMKGTSLSGNAVFVDADKLGSVEKHPALLCWTVLDLDALDVNELTNRLQAQWQENDFMMVIPFGTVHRLMLLGKGADVALRARVLQEMNAGERRNVEPARKSSASGSSSK
jgi:hypothetical protein